MIAKWKNLRWPTNTIVNKQMEKNKQKEYRQGTGIAHKAKGF